jgi:hypothetical protein
MTTARTDPKEHITEVEPQGSDGERSEPERLGGFTSVIPRVRPPGAATNSGVTFIYVGISWEVGVAVGSTINAAFIETQ